MHKIDAVLGPAELLVLKMEKAKLRGRGKSHRSTQERCLLIWGGYLKESLKGRVSENK